MEQAARQVIGIAGPAGAGKTSLVEALAKQLGNAVAIHYDHYERATQQPMERLVRWIEQGADVNEIRLPELVRDLAALRRGEAVIHPLTRAEIRSADRIVFETPLGREHRETGRHIGLLIWIEVPLDVALARKVREFTSVVLKRGKPEQLPEFLAWLHTYLEDYLSAIHGLLDLQRERIRAKADIVLDGRKTFEALVQDALSAIRNTSPG
jgi:uridine kinase